MRTWTLALCALAFGPAATALAVVDVQLYGGARSALAKSSDTATDDEDAPTAATADDTTKYSGTEIGLALHFNPIPMVGVGFFAQQHQAAHTEDDVKESVETTTVGPEVQLRLPLGLVTPFLRAGYTLYGRQTMTAEPKGDAASASDIEKAELDSKVAGFHIGIGARFSLAPMVGLSLQGDIGQEKLTVEKAKVIMNGTSIDADVDDAEKVDWNSQAIQLGLDVSI
jgi:hypothetical protein